MFWMFLPNRSEAGCRRPASPDERDAAARASADYAAELADFEAALAWAAPSPALAHGGIEPRPRAKGAG